MAQHTPRRRSNILVAVLAVYFLASTAYVGYRGIEKVQQLREPTFVTDFDAFYAAAGLLFDSQRGSLYDPSQSSRLAPELRRAPGNYFNPPLFALLYSPLTVLALPEARRGLIFIIAALSAGLLPLVFYWRRGMMTVVLSSLAIASFWPLYETMRYGHISVLFALVAGLALVCLETKRDARAGLLVAFLALKPSIALAPLGFLAWQGQRRALAAAGLGLAGFVLLPFLLLGLHSLDDYRILLSATREDSFTLKGGISGGAAFMFNWNGFIARLFRVDPKPAIVFPFYLLTVLLMVKVWARNDLRTGWLATTLATLLALPHMLWYDWVLVLPAGLALALERPSIRLVSLLVAVHFCVNVSTWQMVDRPLLASAVFVATPAALALLAYLAYEPELDRWLKRRGKAAPVAVAPAEVVAEGDPRGELEQPAS